MNLTKLCKKGGCASKLSIRNLNKLIEEFRIDKGENIVAANLLNEDASILKLDNEKDEYLLNSLDFFTPVTNDAFSYGVISAANSISDIYAMGGKPLSALVILGYPSNIVPENEIKRILKGARSICDLANISIVGGHTLDIKELIFGLSVNGVVKKSNIKLNSSAKPGDRIFITKAIGTGIIFTAEKNDIASELAISKAVNIASRLNSIGELLGNLDCVSSMTDITGFGFIGHLYEMCNGNEIASKIRLDKVPLIQDSINLLEKGVITSGGKSNHSFYNDFVNFGSLLNFKYHELLFDPQTNGGLIFSVAKDKYEYFVSNHLEKLSKIDNLIEIGEFCEKGSASNIINLY